MGARARNNFPNPRDKQNTALGPSALGAGVLFALGLEILFLPSRPCGKATVQLLSSYTTFNTELLLMKSCFFFHHDAAKIRRSVPLLGNEVLVASQEMLFPNDALRLLIKTCYSGHTIRIVW